MKMILLAESNGRTGREAAFMCSTGRLVLVTDQTAFPEPEVPELRIGHEL